MKDEPIVFDATMEQRLLNAHQEWLAQQHVNVVQWNVAQDALIAANCAAIIGLTATVFFLAYRIHRVEGQLHGST